MKAKDFFGKLLSPILWGNLLAMALALVALAFGVKYGLEAYTHHNEGVVVPKLEKMSTADARKLLAEKGLEMMVADSGYNKQRPANSILAQLPNPGVKVKLGRTIYVTVNSLSSPTFAIPDLVDNSSYREAEAKLAALGFKLLPPKRIVGERDWVYGILCHGREVSAGDQVPIETPLTLLVGSGMSGEDEDVDFEDSDEGYPEDKFGAFEETTESGKGSDTDYD